VTDWQRDGEGMMGTARRIVPLLLGIVAAVAIAGVAAFALPGASGPSGPVVRSAEATADAGGAAPASVVAAKEPAPATTPTARSVDPVKIAAARDSFPEVPKADRSAADRKQAERVAAKLAAKEAEAARKAEEEAVRERAEAKAKAEADAQAAAKADQKDQQESKKREGEEGTAEKPTAEKPKDDRSKHDKPKDQKKGEDEQPATPAWWPEHVWGHAVSCTVNDGGASVVGNWDVWLKYGGDWAFVSASPAPAEVSGTDGDKVKLTYRDVTAALHKEHDGKAKYLGGPVEVTVHDAGDTASTRTFKVDLWVVADAEGDCAG
jgi:hypothetical protein